ncbi:hypothetical protein DPMN_164556 [Dreissena polymorpha]|uniref:Uncharacterized protein n=1 Tax=Dreissena polymorpha TaxID=45954 RepID=A0A9D4EVF0_DREPO|nr:hypothetical protein DPMN_164556 [Dreissena polymorpha]
MLICIFSFAKPRRERLSYVKQKQHKSRLDELSPTALEDDTSLNTALYEDKTTHCVSSSSTTEPDSAAFGVCQVKITVPIRVECYILNAVIQSLILSIRTQETWTCSVYIHIKVMAKHI